MDKNRIVKTFTGKKAKRSKCRRIKGEYYIIGDLSIKDSGECYHINSQYHRFNNGLIEYDYNVGRYVLIHKNHLKNGIVDVDENNNPLLGYYSPNLIENVILRDSKTSSKNKDLNCLNESIALKLGYKERLGDGIFYINDDKVKESFFKEISNKLINKNSLPYDSLYSLGIVKEVFEKSFNPDFNNENLNILGDFLEKNKITFGVEFETSDGYLAQRICYKYGVLALRDGSIRGLEYVTVPLSGKKGLYALRELCEKLKERTKYDIKCALHIHVGGLKRNETSILACNNLGYILQNELFDLQPYYKRGNTGVYNNDREKDYSKKIPNSQFNDVNSNLKTVKSKFSKLFEIVSDGRSYSQYDNKLSNVKKHPSDPNGESKWNIRSRYSWLNMVPIIFGNKQTIEFRQHSPTFEFEKVINFLLFCVSFVKFININSKKLCNINSELLLELKDSDNKLNYVIKRSFPKLTFKKIIDRYNNYNIIRKSIMKELSSKGDKLGKLESKLDHKYNDLTQDKFWY